MRVYFEKFKISISANIYIGSHTLWEKKENLDQKEPNSKLTKFKI